VTHVNDEEQAKHRTGTSAIYAKPEESTLDSKYIYVSYDVATDLADFVARDSQFFHTFSDSITIVKPKFERRSEGTLAPRFIDQTARIGLELLSDRLGQIEVKLDGLESRLEMLTTVTAELRKAQDAVVPQTAYSSSFYMGAGLSAFAGVLGYAYFGGFLGTLLAAAATGPFLMSILGLFYSSKQ